jgi:hypothetical protein
LSRAMIRLAIIAIHELFAATSAHDANARARGRCSCNNPECRREFRHRGVCDHEC